MSDIKVRFAPSPTGFLHVGGARTALFNWLYARAQGGTFVLRLEDTDKMRSEDRFLDDILESMKWLGLDWDEEIEKQSEREGIHKEHIKKLLDQDLAYYEGEAVRFRTPKEVVIFGDIIRGKIEIDTAVFEDDLVIQKSDGSPTYNLACVVDDATMGITHVMRGEDHITNTPKQILLYKALGYKVPKFAHLPLILGMDRTRLSKRSGAVAVTEYRRAGFLPEALINFLALLGWSPKDDKEIMPLDELVKKFSLKNINKTGASFDQQKLEWINGQYIRKKSVADLKPLLIEQLTASNISLEGYADEWVNKLIELFKVRIRTLEEFAPKIQFLISDDIVYDEQAVQEHLKKDGVKDMLSALTAALESVPAFTETDIETCVRAFADERGLKGKDIIHPIRVAVTGVTQSPGLFEILTLLGKERTLARLQHALDVLCK